MTLLEELQGKRLDAIQNHALKIAEDLEPLLIEGAERGHRGYNIGINGRDDAHILVTDEFVENLSIMLEGCKVEIEKKIARPAFGRPRKLKTLVISW